MKVTLFSSISFSNFYFQSITLESNSCGLTMHYRQKSNIMVCTDDYVLK